MFCLTLLQIVVIFSRGPGPFFGEKIHLSCFLFVNWTPSQIFWRKAKCKISKNQFQVLFVFTTKCSEYFCVKFQVFFCDDIPLHFILARPLHRLLGQLAVLYHILLTVADSQCFHILQLPPIFRVFLSIDGFTISLGCYGSIIFYSESDPPPAIFFMLMWNYLFYFTSFWQTHRAKLNNTNLHQRNAVYAPKDGCRRMTARCLQVIYELHVQMFCLWCMYVICTQYPTQYICMLLSKTNTKKWSILFHIELWIYTIECSFVLWAWFV